MSTWPVRNEQDRETLIRVIKNREKLPFTASLKMGAPRSNEQNRLMWKWFSEVSLQADEGKVPDEYHQDAKLDHGIPILCEDDPLFAESWEILEKNFTYLQLKNHIKKMAVTSVMTTKQKTRFLDVIHRDYANRGYTVTEPEQ